MKVLKISELIKCNKIKKRQKTDQQANEVPQEQIKILMKQRQKAEVN